MRPPWWGRGQGPSTAPSRMPGVPYETWGLIACVTAGLSFMVYSGYRTFWYSPEVHLSNKTRQDELFEENPDIAEKGHLFSKTSAYLSLGKIYAAGSVPSLFPETKICKPEDTPLPGKGEDMRRSEAS